MMMVQILFKNFRFAVLALIVSCFLTISAQAQTTEIRASVDTNIIVIGGQYALTIEAVFPQNVKGVLPVPADTFSHMEVVKRLPIDTITGKSKNTILLRQKLILTSFDSGFHVIPPFVFNYLTGNDTTQQLAESKPLLVTVKSVAVDTNKAIKDLKGQMVIPFAWQEALPYIFGAILLLVIIFLVYRYFKNRKPVSKVVEIAIPKRPAHEIALEQLAALDAQKLWQQGNFKAYYTELSDITRTFIQNRWMVNAMEMTTDEILHLSFIKNQTKTGFDELKYLLELSDLVKFAKMIPVVFENEQCMKNAVNFVKAEALNAVKKEEQP